MKHKMTFLKICIDSLVIVLICGFGYVLWFGSLVVGTGFGQTFLFSDISFMYYVSVIVSMYMVVMYYKKVVFKLK